MSDSPPRSQRRWFPFTATEVEVALAVFAFLESVLFLLGVSREAMLAAAGGYAGFVYLAGLAVSCRRSSFHLELDGALQGRGYLRHFRSARRSLLLLHTDDDEPCEELIAVYRTLLEQGVQIRRVIFARPERRPGAYAWVERFGAHAGLKQRVVRQERAALTRHSFVVVDGAKVLLSIPGGEATDTELYSSALVLRHLLTLEDARVAQAFTEIHGQLWSRAEVLDESSASQL